MYPINEITDDSIPNSPPVIAKTFESRTYVITEYGSIFSPMANPPPMITMFQIACTIPLFQTEPLSIAIIENITPTIVPAIMTNKQLPIEKSCPRTCTIPNNIDGTITATFIFHLFFNALSITPLNTISSTNPAAIPVNATPALKVLNISFPFIFEETYSPLNIKT